jgi:hypothetical protein
VLGKRIYEISRSLSVSVLFSDIRIRKLSNLHKATVFYQFTAIYGPFYTTWTRIGSGWVIKKVSKLGSGRTQLYSCQRESKLEINASEREYSSIAQEFFRLFCFKLLFIHKSTFKELNSSFEIRTIKHSAVT